MLSMDRYRNVPQNHVLRVRNSKIKHDLDIRLTAVGFGDDLSPAEIKADAKKGAKDFMRFLYDCLDPLVLDELMEMFLRQEPVERVVEVVKETVAQFRITDPGHAHLNKQGEMLYVESGNVWYLWIDGGPVQVRADQVVKVE